MKNKVLPSTTLVYFLLLVFGCTSMSVPPGQTQCNLPEKELLARKMPELSIATEDRLLERVKIASLLGNELSALPFPYWNVETIKINIEKITLIRLLNVKKYNIPNALTASNITFAIVGGACAITSQYKNQYQDGLAAASLLAAGVGAMALIAVILSSLIHKKWDFTELTLSQRLGVLTRIMGVQL